MKYILNKTPRARLLICTKCGALWADDEFKGTADDMKGYADYESKCPICDTWNLIDRYERISITKEQYDELTENKIYLFPESYKIISDNERVE